MYTKYTRLVRVVVIRFDYCVPAQKDPPVAAHGRISPISSLQVCTYWLPLSLYMAFNTPQGNQRNLDCKNASEDHRRGCTVIAKSLLTISWYKPNHDISLCVSFVPNKQVPIPLCSQRSAQSKIQKHGQLIRTLSIRFIPATQSH